MQIDIHRPELEQRVRRQIQSGQYHDVDELLTKALDALEEKAPMPELASASVKRTGAVLLEVLEASPYP